MSVQKDPLRLVALMHGAHHLVVRASLAAKPHEQDKRDGLRLLPQIEEALSAWPKPLSRCVDDGRAIEHFFEGHIDSVCSALCPERDPDPMHERAHAAIDRLGLDGSNLELAVAVFGWGSDEANGSLLGLVRSVWGWTHAVPMKLSEESPWYLGPQPTLPIGVLTFIGRTEVETLVVALEMARQP